MNPTFNAKSLATIFWKQGYLHIPHFFPLSLMDEYNQKIVDHFGMDPDFEHSEEFIKKSGAEVIPWFPQQEGETCFNKVNQHTQLSELTEAILGSGWYEQYSMVMFSKKGTVGQAWHQDCLCDDPKRFNLNRLVYTMDISPHTTGGQTTVVPKSHLMGMIPSLNEELNEKTAISLSPKKGDLLLLHGHCYHKVEKVIGQYRVSTNYRAASKNTPENITDIGVYRNMVYEFSSSTVVEER